MFKQTLRHKVGIILALAHLVLFIWSTYIVIANYDSGQAIMGYFYIFIMDFFLFPLLSPVAFIFGFLKLPFMTTMIVLFGICGTVIWFFIPQWLTKGIFWLKKRLNKHAW